jgi:hypothetical protein
MRKLDSKILRIQEIIGVSSMLMEASKKDVLVKKLGIKEELADELDSICGGLSVIMTKKILNWYEDLTPNNRESATELFNRRGITPAMRQSLTSIMDWIRVGLNGNLNQYRDLSFNDLVSKSKEWHDSLQLGQGAINYEEKNNIIKDLGRHVMMYGSNDKFLDMCLMTKCEYHIIANSSFSWWGSWLSNSKKTIAPKSWFGPSPNMPKNWNDIYAEEWNII